MDPQRLGRKCIILEENRLTSWYGKYPIIYSVFISSRLGVGWIFRQHPSTFSMETSRNLFGSLKNIPRWVCKIQPTRIQNPYRYMVAQRLLWPISPTFPLMRLWDAEINKTNLDFPEIMGFPFLSCLLGAPGRVFGRYNLIIAQSVAARKTTERMQNQTCGE